MRTFKPLLAAALAVSLFPLPVAAEEASLNDRIAALPESMLLTEDVEKDYLECLSIKEAYEALSDEEKEGINYDKVAELLNANSDTLNVENVEKGTVENLEGKTIGYLGSSITYGFATGGVAFPEYIEQMSGSESVKQAISGGPLALVEGVRDEISYVRQLWDGALKDVEHLDALVVQLSTNDASLGIPVGELSESFKAEDLDYSTIMGAMEYIIAYAKEKWNCPVLYYVNPYLTDDAIDRFANGDENTAKILHEQYQGVYEDMIAALYEIQGKWGIDVVDMWNDPETRNVNNDLRPYFMSDPIHPFKAGYYFWYAPKIMAQLAESVGKLDAADDLNARIAALPDTLLDSEDVEKDHQECLAIKAIYDEMDKEAQLNVNYDKVAELLNGNSDTLNVENVEAGTVENLEGKTIGYLGSSITYGFATGGMAFPEYIEKMSGSTSIKQAISGGTLALKEGVREEISYITQLWNGALKDVEHLDALVVQLSTNDASNGIEIGELSESFNVDDMDYSNVTGAMEYIIAYAKEKWNCPVLFYINPYLTVEGMELYTGSYESAVAAQASFAAAYEDMINALGKVQAKWGIDVVDMWNDPETRNVDLSLFFMNDPIHPRKAGYYFWYAPKIMAQLAKTLEPRTADLAKTGANTYAYSSSGKSDFSNIASPAFYVYAGAKTESEAEALIDELGLLEHVNRYDGSVTVVTPFDGKAYGEAEAEQFNSLLGIVSNVKVIGIDDGATFVNNCILPQAYAVAGIMTYGGEIGDVKADIPVPAYLSNPAAGAKAVYEAANKNTDSPLAVVVTGEDGSLAEAYANAWKNVFAKNYRQMNEVTEFYNVPATAVTDPYPLYALIINMEDDFGVNYYPHYNEPLNGEGSYTWFEYIPQSTLEAEDGTVPLIVTLHGNGNDARIQGETTGWVELAGQEGFMVVAPEWQDVVLDSATHEANPNFFGCDGLEGDKLIEWISMLEEKYPQIDKTRIYVTGLSAGASASSLYAVKYSNVFAGAAAVSGPGVDKTELLEIAGNYEGGEVPYLYICGDHDFFGMIPVDGSSPYQFHITPDLTITMADPNVSMFEFIQAYQKVNGIPVSETYDLSLNEYYGVALENVQWSKLGEKEMMDGTLSNRNGAIIRLAAIKNHAHWNYKPEAEYIWNFFKDFARDTETGKLIRINGYTGFKDEAGNEISFKVVEGKLYWFEDGVQQGVYGDTKNIWDTQYDRIERGREIYDPNTDAWYWLDANDNGAVAKDKEVWMPYIFQGEDPATEGKWVRYDKYGQMIKGWYANDNGVYYYDLLTGAMLKGTHEINGKTYTFDTLTGIMQ
ncbi:MAG: hypothetical protein IKD69_01065 [Solobacterium sp.]|nr:hypothetical protein [Solobacterium sp.]